MTFEAESKPHQCECDICQAGTDSETARFHHQMNLVLSRLNESQPWVLRPQDEGRRWFVGFLSQKADSPTDQQLARIIGLDRKTIRRGRRELESALADVPQGRQRRAGGGRLPAEKKTQS
jgi:hypothetical protein